MNEWGPRLLCTVFEVFLTTHLLPELQPAEDLPSGCSVFDVKVTHRSLTRGPSFFRGPRIGRMPRFQLQAQLFAVVGVLAVRIAVLLLRLRILERLVAKATTGEGAVRQTATLSLNASPDFGHFNA